MPAACWVWERSVNLSGETIRAFIAISLPDRVKKELDELEKILKRRCPDVIKWVEPGSIHLTLKFLGQTTDDKIEEINLGIEYAANGIAPFELVVKDVGAFPNLNRAQVLWVGLQGDLNALAGLQQRVTNNMEQLGFPKEERAFSPHLTIGRVRNYTSPEDCQKIGKVLAETKFEAAPTIIVNEVNLMQSKLTPAGAIYTKLSGIPLKG
jgi:RNA 2',3'-cyclic 3'-phosphodiesterase